MTIDDSEAKESSYEERLPVVSSAKKSSFAKNRENSSNIKKGSKPLSIRPDVMNKNIFRTLKKQCKRLFNLKHASGKNFNSNLNKFANKMLTSIKSEVSSIADFEKVRFTKYMGLLINYCSMKKNFKTEEDHKMAQEFNDVLYKYTHRSFNEFVMLPEIKAIIILIFKKVSVANFVAKSDVLSKHTEEYESRINQLFMKCIN